MKINKKYFLNPPKSNLDLKQILQFAVAQGIGRPIVADGFADKAWSSEMLAEAVSLIETNPTGVETRTVQHWLQNNNAAISHANLRWLARIFGCNDPDCVAIWLDALIEGKRLLKEKVKREKKTILRPGDAIGSIKPQPSILENSQKYVEADKRHFIASFSERIFHGKSVINLASINWFGWYLLLFATMITGIHQISYNLSNGTIKQIGFVWSVSWTINPILVIPIFTIIVYKMISYWKFKGRGIILQTTNHQSVISGWDDTIQNNGILFKLTFFSSWFFVFLLQWLGIHLYNLLNEGSSNILIDWYFTYLVRPDVISFNKMILVSFLGWAYQGLIFWFVLLGLAFTYIVANDFFELMTKEQDSARIKQISEGRLQEILDVGNVLTHKIFLAVIVCILVATFMKLQAAYVVSFSPNLLAWLFQDSYNFFTLDYVSSARMSNTTIPYFTSFALGFFALFIFIYGFSQINYCIKNSVQEYPVKLTISSHRVFWVLGLVVINYLALASFVGFSILFLITLAVVAISILGYKETLAIKSYSDGI